MYSLVSAIGVPVAAGSRWTAISIGSLSMSAIFQQYRRVIATLSNPALTANVGLDFDVIRQTTQGLSTTFAAYLTANGSASLPTITGTIPTIKPVYAKYADAFHAGYTVTPVGPYQAIDSPIPAPDRTWLYLTKAGVDFTLFENSCLVSVNGFYHWSETNGAGIYVKNGDVSRQKSLAAQVGITSFREVGSITTIPITAGMLYKPDSTVPMRYRTYINLGVSMTGKVPMLVLGGYLHVLDPKTFVQVNDTSIMVDVENLPILNRYYESSPYLDFSSLALPSNNVNSSQIGVSDLLGDAALTAYFTLSQSFVVLLDETNVFVDRSYLRTTTFAGKYISGIPPIYPLVNGFGRTCEYWYKLEDTKYTQYAVNVRDGIEYNYLFNTVMDASVLRTVTDQIDPDNPGTYSPAYFNLIGIDVDVSGLTPPTA